MRILYVTEYAPDTGAIADYTYHLSRELAEQYDVAIDVLNVSGEAPEELHGNVDVIGAIPDEETGWGQYMSREYDLAHFHYYLPNLRSFLMYALKGGEHPDLLMTLHDVPTGWKHRILFSVFRSLVLLTDATEEEFRSEYRFLRRLLNHDIYRAPYLGLDEDLPARVAARDIETGLDPDATNIVCPGFVHEKKGFHKVVAVLPELAGEFPDVQLTIAGGQHREGSDAYMERLNAAIEEHDVEDRVTVTGVLPSEDHVNAYIQDADVVVLPFDEISQSATLAKTLALGTVPVVTPLDTIVPVVEKYGGVVMEADDDISLIRGIRQAVQDPPEIDDKKIRRDLSWETNADIYAEVYRNIIGEGV